MAEQTERTTEDIVDNNNGIYFVDRIVEKEVPYSEGENPIIFIVEQLSSDKVIFANSKAVTQNGTVDNSLLVWWSLKLALKGFKNFKTSAGKIQTPIFDSVAIFGETYQILSDKTLKGIPYPVLMNLYQVVQAITFMSAEEVEKLDFFTPAAKASNATQTAEDPIVKKPARKSKLSINKLEEQS